MKIITSSNITRLLLAISQNDIKQKTASVWVKLVERYRKLSQHGTVCMCLLYTQCMMTTMFVWSFYLIFHRTCTIEANTEGIGVVENCLFTLEVF